jgi:antitoxin component YwqK of YwqJK toxin-antitoxin module
MNQFNDINERDGMWEKYDINGQIRYRGSYVNGKRTGFWEHYWLGGDLIWNGCYVEDIPHGYWEIRDFKSRLFEKEFHL